jgi:hypothetical protein
VISVTRAAKVPLFLFLLMAGTAGPLAADQATPRAATTQASAAKPAPKASPLFKPAARETGTIAEAQQADSAASSSGGVTISNSALLLVIIVLLLVIIV